MNKISDALIEQIKTSADIVDIISGYLALNKTGSNFKGLCPFHSEKTPSFIVSPDKQIWHCFGCGAGGNVINFLMKIDKLNFYETIKLLAGKTGIALPDFDSNVTEGANDLFEVNNRALNFYKKSLLKNKQALSYLHNRSITDETITLFGIGYAPDGWDAIKNILKSKKIEEKYGIASGILIHNKKKNKIYDRFRNRIMFPIFNIGGKPIGFSGRILDETGKIKSAKYINSPETKIFFKGQNLYGLNLSKRYISDYDSVIIVEGQMDLIMCFQYGIKNVAATSGTALTEYQVRLLSRYTKNFILLFDSDKSGLNAAERNIDVILKEDIYPKVAVLDDSMDPADFLEKYGKKDFLNKITKAQSFIDFKLDRLVKKYDITNITGKKKVIYEISKKLSVLSDAVILDEYIDKMSSILKIKTNLIAEEVQRLIKKIKSRPKNFDVSKQIQDYRNFPVDKKILQFIIAEDNEKFVKLFKKSVPVETYKEPYKIIMQAIYDYENSNLNKLLNKFDDEPKYKNILTEVSVKQADYKKGEEGQLIQDYIFLMNKRLNQNKIASIRTDMNKNLSFNDCQKRLLKQIDLRKKF